jgi:hypothetical protein
MAVFATFDGEFGDITAPLGWGEAFEDTDKLDALK